jgi:hypothetical protein
MLSFCKFISLLDALHSEMYPRTAHKKCQPFGPDLSAETDLTSPPPLALARCESLQSLGYVVWKKRLGTLILTGSAILWLLTTRNSIMFRWHSTSALSHKLADNSIRLAEGTSCLGKVDMIVPLDDCWRRHSCDADTTASFPTRFCCPVTKFTGSSINGAFADSWPKRYVHGYGGREKCSCENNLKVFGSTSSGTIRYEDREERELRIAVGNSVELDQLGLVPSYK